MPQLRTSRASDDDFPTRLSPCASPPAVYAFLLRSNRLASSLLRFPLRSPRALLEKHLLSGVKDLLLRRLDRLEPVAEARADRGEDGVLP